MAGDALDLTSQLLQPMGEVVEEDAIVSLALRRVDYGMDETSDNRLLWRARIEKSLRAGSLSRLVRQLAPLGEEEESVSAYRTCFLTTYRTFATPDDVLGEIKDWYCKVSLTSDMPQTEVVSKTKTQRSILTFLRLWFDKYPLDWTPSLISQVTEFLRQHQQPHNTLDISDLLQHMSAATLSSPPSSPPSSNTCTHKIQLAAECLNFTLNTLSPPQFAQALTARDAALFRAVKPHQCLHYIRRQQQMRADTVQSCIEQFNRLSLIVISTVLQPPISQFDTNSAYNRSLCIAQWISIAHNCRLLKNFSSLKAIISSLESSAIFRLSRSWAAVPNDQMTLFKDLQQLLSHEHNHQASRDILNKEGTGKHVISISPRKGKNSRTPVEVVHGVVPYLGTFLTDLTMLHTAYPDQVKDGLINMDKRRMEFEVLAKLSLFQSAASKYSYTLNPVFEQWMDTVRVLTETDSYELSKDLEEDMLNKPDSKPDSQCQAIFKKTLHVIAKGRSLSRSSSPTPSEGGTPEKEQLPQVDNDSFPARVSLSNSEICMMYKTVILSKADRTSTVVKVLLEKLDLSDSPNCYTLIQVTSQGNMTIPEGATVYYALLTDPATVPQLRLQLKDCHVS